MTARRTKAKTKSKISKRLSTKNDGAFSKMQWAGAFGVFALAMGYALYTNHIWEDYFITFRHSQNLVEGKGLVFQVGERTHGFTSPLGVLLPALTYLVSFSKDYVAGMWIFRLLCALLLAGAFFLNVETLARQTGMRRFSTVLVTFLVYLECKTVSYSVNGMETAILLFFISFSVYHLFSNGAQKWKWFGLGAAGILLSRPDGIITIGALSAAYLLFFDRKEATWRGLVKAGLFCAAAYAPWLIFATLYYGSPIPHTIAAKSLGHFPDPISAFWKIRMIAGFLFMPINSFFGGWPWYLVYLGQAVSVLPLLYWILPTNDRFGRTTSLIFLIGCWYLSAIYASGWYIPQFTIFGLLTYASFALNLYGWCRPRLQKFAWVPSVAVTAPVAIFLLCLLACTFREMKIQQEVVELGNRKQIGLWLKDHMGQDETVYLECLGYIGYFSGGHMLDYPGLASPRVVKAIRSGSSGFDRALASVGADWAVLRPSEVEMIKTNNPEFLGQYHLEKRFDVSEQLNRYGNFPGKGYADFDSVFEVYRRNVTMK